MSTELENIENFLEKKFKKVLNIYEYGSRVYGYKKSQDKDYIIVVADNLEKPQQYNLSSRDLTIYSKEQFQEQINRHEISALECIWLSPSLILKEDLKFNFKLNKTTLRSSCGKKSSNSWVKAKKKLTISKSPYIGKKSLFHSLRILYFALQIAHTGKITDYSISNPYWDKISNNEDWNFLQKEFQKIYNQKKTELRILCPK